MVRPLLLMAMRTMSGKLGSDVCCKGKKKATLRNESVKQRDKKKKILPHSWLCFLSNVHSVHGSHRKRPIRPAAQPSAGRPQTIIAGRGGRRGRSDSQLTFTSKKAQPKVGQRYSPFRKDSLASSTVMRPRLVRAAGMLCKTADTRMRHFEVLVHPLPPPPQTPSSLQAASQQILAAHQQHNVDIVPLADAKNEAGSVLELYY